MGSQPPMHSKRIRYAFISDVVAQCKVELPGITTDNPANRLVAHEWLTRQMKERGMRPAHIKKMIWIAIELIFIKDSDQIFAEQFVQSNAYINRLEEGSNSYHSRDKPWMFNLLGARRRTPRSAGTL